MDTTPYDVYEDSDGVKLAMDSNGQLVPIDEKEALNMAEMKQAVWDAFYHKKVSSTKGKHPSNRQPPKKKRKK